MDTKNISNLFLKVGGILILILSSSNISRYVYAYTQLPDKNISLFIADVILPNILPLLLGFFIFVKPDKITNKIIDNDSINKLENSNFLIHVEVVCLSVLGFYMLLKSSADIVYYVVNFIQAKANVAGRGVPIKNTLIFTPTFISTIFEFVFSLWLILGVKGIVNFINHIRTANNK